MRGARAHAARDQARYSGAVPRHRPSFSANARVSRRDRGAMGTELGDVTRSRSRAGTVAAIDRGVLRPPQGRAAVLGARGLRRVVYRASARAVAVAGRVAGGRAVPAAGWQGPA